MVRSGLSPGVCLPSSQFMHVCLCLSEHLTLNHIPSPVCAFCLLLLNYHSIYVFSFACVFTCMSHSVFIRSQWLTPCLTRREQRRLTELIHLCHFPNLIRIEFLCGSQLLLYILYKFSKQVMEMLHLQCSGKACFCLSEESLVFSSFRKSMVMCVLSRAPGTVL